MEDICIYTARQLLHYCNEGSASLRNQYVKTNADVTTVCLERGSNEMWVVSAYMPHGDVVGPPPAILGEITAEARRRGVGVIIGADANAHHSIWGSSDTNTRGGALLQKNAIKPDSDHVPHIENIALQLRTKCKIKQIPISELSTIVDDSDFDISKSVVIASSGWLTNANKSDDVLEGLEKAYNCRNDTNFLSIVVGPYIQTLYTWLTFNTHIIGKNIANALVDLTKVVPLENFHLMGHSLGAQIVGEIARHFTKLTGEKIPRVTGFDPAGPCFNYEQQSTTLSSSDADYVDIIHTNPGIAGQYDHTGDADFYVGGHFAMQNGCKDITCSHQRSWQYYMESVYPGNEQNFLSKRCDSLLHLQQGRCMGKEYPMGYALTNDVKGIFILEVNDKEPFGINTSLNYMQLDNQCGKCEE
ncbi:vitellogenin-2-like [Eurosta solidaginis]|uniref:vitellogenin-2-like n=1 Tax=Eurosta solidaginis TaxID=178769 RepID=UPI0035306A4F